MVDGWVFRMLGLVSGTVVEIKGLAPVHKGEKGEGREWRKEREGWRVEWERGTRIGKMIYVKSKFRVRGDTVGRKFRSEKEKQLAGANVVFPFDSCQ